ncbi:kinase-like protein [Zopfia rhizophila CBS 207.26]|uniref:Kinase-like protein n=1 Tax=Zopfia rhizophila CBS 207.26 TaxID=1314779 RepID=A0A6A6DGS3_9PEZI|nr:kinase-like protein [Zopfia rhizophila CBS 207.26]
MQKPSFALNDEMYDVAASGALVSYVDEIRPEDLRKGHGYQNLRGLLRKCQGKHTDSKSQYWPDKRLRRIMTRERVIEELERLQAIPKYKALFAEQRSIHWYADLILPRGTSPPDIENGAENGNLFEDSLKQGLKSEVKCFMKIFVLLSICDQYKSFKNFIDVGICDDDLPLRFEKTEDDELKLQDDFPDRVELFSDWNLPTVELFERTQYELLIPYLSHPHSDEKFIRHVQYGPETILPWKEDLSKQTQGGYGLISCIRIHPDSHGFHPFEQVKAAGGLFALKHITAEKIGNFENESQMLRMFCNYHKHFVKLLITLNIEDRNYLLFPWAGCDLETYWSSKDPPYDTEKKCMKPMRMKWLSEQIKGLVSALHKFHNPSMDLLSDKVERYARHGDLKPENILWFKSDRDEDGILVIGDLGISAINRKESRSNIPNHSVPHSPDYRPPECDQQGGTISRAFDIWTLGCLLLEMVCWALGGQALLREFGLRRMVPYLGVLTNIFFDVKKTWNGRAAILVKEVVVEWMSRLHNHERCTEYFQDLLDAIHDHMIVVLSKEAERIQSGPLLEKITLMDQKVVLPEYGEWPSSKRRSYPDPVAVETYLNENAAGRFKGCHNHLNQFAGDIQKGKTPVEMEKIK